MAERTNAVAWKAANPERGSQVRILYLPPHGLVANDGLATGF